MIHYIDGKPSKNIRLNKAKRHALNNYRHTQRVNKIKDIAIRLFIVLSVGGILTAIYLSR